jgi:hypothetical protein
MAQPIAESGKSCCLSTVRVCLSWALCVWLNAGCTWSPLKPSETPPALVISPELQAAYDALGANTSMAEWADDTVGGWATTPRAALSQIVVANLPVGVQGEYNHVDTIAISARLLEQAPEIIAGFIAHELRHADGLRHDCSDGARDTSSQHGAWYVQVEVLESYGLADRAAIIRDHKFCGP